MIDAFLNALRARMAAEAASLFPEEMFATFAYTRTGNNLCHPRVLGLLVSVAWSLPGVAAVEVDVHLNEAGLKFQPDVILRDASGMPLLIIDYESPNSSDTRLATKDVGAYVEWIACGSAPPYLVITTLPDRERTPAQWWLLWAAKTQYNFAHRGAAHQIRLNPFRYWYAVLVTSHPGLRDGTFGHDVTFANFDGRTIAQVDFSTLPAPAAAGTRPGWILGMDTAQAQAALDQAAANAAARALAVRWLADLVRSALGYQSKVPTVYTTSIWSHLGGGGWLVLDWSAGPLVVKVTDRDERPLITVPAPAHNMAELDAALHALWEGWS